MEDRAVGLHRSGMAPRGASVCYFPDNPLMSLQPANTSILSALLAQLDRIILGKQEVLRHIFTQIHADEDLLRRVEHMRQIQQEARLNV